MNTEHHGEFMMTMFNVCTVIKEMMDLPLTNMELLFHHDSIGHGYHIAQEPDVMEEMRRKNIHFEICPTSSDETGGWNYEEDGKNWKEHPAIAMMRYGLNIGLNSDDPAVFDTSLTWQYRIAVGKMGLTKKCILRTLHSSIDAAFLDDEGKASVRRRVDEYLDEDAQESRL